MKTRFKFYAGPVKGFTVMEVMIALSLMGIAAVCSYDLLRTGLERYRRLQAATVQKQEAAIALALLSKDIRSAFLSAVRPSIRFVGHPDESGDRLDFFRTGGPPGVDPQVEFVSYFLNGNGTGNNILRRTAHIDFLAVSPVVDLCSHIKNFELKYFNGKTWEEDWGWDAVQKKPFEGIRGLPLLVSVKLTLVDAEQRTWEETRVIPVMTSLLNEASGV